MRVAMLHWAFPPIIGGVESHLAMLCPELARYGCQVSLLTGSTLEGEMDYTWRGLRILRRRLMDLNSLDAKKIMDRRNDIRRLIGDFIQQVHPDIIHAHNMHYFSPVHLEALLEAKRRWGIPLVLTAHNVWSDSVWEEMCRHASEWDAVIAVSHYIKKELVKAGFPEDRITVVHHGIDLERFRPPTKEDLQKAWETYPELKGKRVIFHPARMSFDKGCHISIKAFKLIKEQFPDALLVLAGTEKTVDWGSRQPEHVSMIKRLITELGLERDVSIRFFSWDEIPLMYQAAEICIYPSCFEEPFGLAMLESLATGRPMVVSRAGGMPEVIQDDMNGYVVPMHDHEALAERCCHLLANPQKARQMGETGRQMVEKNFTREVMTARTLQVYGKVLAFYLRKQTQIA
ncbi:glycosyltransferase involved in cell wall biosynthesis [Desulfofundulus luciae]|uniref:Glycosyltransferase involved in cell wall biosynthesis n=1 Tax=Desulfofundulus luciae TaxID=74702 RepID=A0ABU0B1Q5_9FIRM|nr:glycosyltransferase family 4 protein [Desulfofundulus luciae]MDQ0285846.1 glycosyltransferase involved in cell wall biosynthesis [Desulfofundulus luciae]